jgi:hypothetical protein
MKNFTRNQLTAISSLMLFHLAACQVIPDYYYAGDLQSKTEVFVGYQGEWTLSVGFWISAEMQSGVNCPFLSLQHSGVSTPETFEIRTETASTYAIHGPKYRYFDFKGSTNNASFSNDYVTRTVGTFWDYFAFNYFVLDTETLVTYSKNSQYKIYFYAPTAYSLNSMTIKVGNTSPLKSCLNKFRIFKFDIVYDILNPLFGSYYDPLLTGLFNAHPFYAIYKLNMSPFARNFVNLRDYKSGELMATIVSPQKARTALNFPRTGDQIYRYTFGISPIKVFYDPKIIRKSPINNSYTFFINYKAVGTNYLAKNCRKVNDCLVHDYKFLFYSRSNQATPAKPIISASRSWSFKELSQEARYTLDGTSSQIYKDEITLPQNYIDFNFNSNSSFLYLTVDDVFLKANPFVKICFYIKIYACSLNQAIISTFKGDDIHQTSSSSQQDSYYIYIFIGEISIHGGTEVQYQSSQNTLWASSKGNDIIYARGYLDLYRIANDSFDYIVYFIQYDVGINNCSTSIFGCEYCLQQECLTCRIGFALFDSRCYYSGSGCDYLTRVCGQQFMATLTFENMNLILPLLLTYSWYYIKSLNISFYAKTDLSNPVSKGSVNRRAFTMYYNSLENSFYDALLPAFTLDNRRSEKDVAIITIFRRFWEIMRQYEWERTYIVTTQWSIYADEFFRTESLALFEDNICYNDIILVMIQSDVNQYKCEVLCPESFFLNVQTMACEPCAEHCLYCESAENCLACDFIQRLGAEDGKCVTASYWISADGKTTYYSELYQRVLQDAFFANLEKVQNLACLTGYTKIGDSCEHCPTGCLKCTENLACIACDSNYKLDENRICQFLHSIVEIKKNDQSSIEECGNCFQVKSSISPGCKTCHDRCKCSLVELNSENSYTFRCIKVLFSSSYLQSNKEQTDYSYQQASTDNAFNLISKSNSTLFSYVLDLNLVSNTSNCFFDSQKVYTSNRLTYLKNETHSSSQKSRQTEALFVSNDLIILTLSVISGPLGNVAIGLLQFNKIFMYLSLSDAEGGQFFQFINKNLYATKNSGSGFRIPPSEQYEFLTEYDMRSGDKMASKFTFIVFASLLAVQQTMFIISYILSRFKDKPSFENFKNNLINFAFKLLRAISYRYNNIIVASLSFLIANARYIKSPYYKSLYIILLCAMLYYPISLYDKALNYIDSAATEPMPDYAFLNSLNSPHEWRLNQALLRNRLIDECLVIVKSFVLYHCRKYKEMLLVVAILLNVIEFFVVVYLYKVIRRSFTNIKLLGIVSFTLFTVLMLIGYLNFHVPDYLFEALYLVSNMLKLIEVVGSSVFVAKKNQYFKHSLRRVHPANEFDNEDDN